MPSLLHELRQFVPSLTDEKLNSSPLGWGVKEQVLLALLARLPSASTRNASRLMRGVASQYRDARRTWRQAKQKSDGRQGAGDANGGEARASQQEQGQRFRRKFLELAGTELSRLGAPPELTWNALLVNEANCLQAFAFLLARVQSHQIE